MRAHQYTIRGVPAELDRAIRKRATEDGKSVNQMSLDLLRHGIEMEDVNHDLDWIEGTWTEDGIFDEAVRSQRRIDRSLWK